MDSKTQEIFAVLFELPDNKVCFECAQPSNQWASVNNGVFLCLSFSGLHRGFGVNVSFVRSVTMDSWSDLQLSLMKSGGNLKLRQFFEYYKMPKDAPMDFKYKTRAGAYYRELLKALAEGRDPPSAPSEVEGLELVGNIAPPTNFTPGSYQGFGSSPPSDDNKFSFSLDKAKVAMIGAFAEASKVTKQVVQKVNDKVTDPEFKQSVKDVGSKIASETKSVANTMVANTKAIGKELPGLAEKGAATLKKGWSDAVSFIKKKTGAAPQNDTIVVDNGSYQEYFQANPASNNNVIIKDEALQDMKKTDDKKGGHASGSGWNNDW